MYYSIFERAASYHRLLTCSILNHRQRCMINVEIVYFVVNFDTN
ncbi:Uncharacterised protein [Vibrio cholerae]|uniref:Uncharacterized protein n=1 Tax=Vibrio cholerae TaxID=666 RepID=A0A655ZNV5_VIBCL|nr:Uncharacterised protein [Vibrio cholerae]CSC75729.1 Uncharacterised protein [Vibrio cholerae]CSC91797.1 Uncharacterised protein [Vibrio cholerae]CSI95721.1 Uncharacterised protein [Vibrio cholerae]